MKHALKGFVLLLVALAIVRLAVMVVAPVFDPSEGRYAAICANMAESGDFLVPRFIHNRVFQSFDGKPPLLFQLGGAFCTVLGRREIAVRLPSFLAALGLLGLLFLVLRRLRDAAAARVAVLVCATSVAFYATAGFCMTDLLLTFCVGGALLLECVFHQKPEKWVSRAVFALLGLGMLVKGPVALVLFGLPVFLDACANRRFALLARHDWIGGPLVFLLLTAPWYVLMEQQTPGFLKYFFLHENLLRFLVHDYGDTQSLIEVDVNDITKLNTAPFPPELRINELLANEELSFAKKDGKYVESSKKIIEWVRRFMTFGENDPVTRYEHQRAAGLFDVYEE